jgi:hypothetical protein
MGRTWKASFLLEGVSVPFPTRPARRRLLSSDLALVVGTTVRARFPRGGSRIELDRFILPSHCNGTNIECIRSQICIPRIHRFCDGRFSVFPASLHAILSHFAPDPRSQFESVDVQTIENANVTPVVSRQDLICPRRPA